MSDAQVVRQNKGKHRMSDAQVGRQDKGKHRMSVAQVDSVDWKKKSPIARRSGRYSRQEKETTECQMIR
jgi:hypothetical protein